MYHLNSEQIEASEEVGAVPNLAVLQAAIMDHCTSVSEQLSCLSAIVIYKKNRMYLLNDIMVCSLSLANVLVDSYV